MLADRPDPTAPALALPAALADAADSLPRDVALLLWVADGRARVLWSRGRHDPRTGADRGPCVRLPARLVLLDAEPGRDLRGLLPDTLAVDGIFTSAGLLAAEGVDYLPVLERYGKKRLTPELLTLAIRSAPVQSNEGTPMRHRFLFVEDLAADGLLLALVTGPGLRPTRTSTTPEELIGWLILRIFATLATGESGPR